VKCWNCNVSLRRKTVWTWDANLWERYFADIFPDAPEEPPPFCLPCGRACEQILLGGLTLAYRESGSVEHLLLIDHCIRNQRRLDAQVAEHQRSE
jgi:hypothetical protein